LTGRMMRMSLPWFSLNLNLSVAERASADPDRLRCTVIRKIDRPLPMVVGFGAAISPISGRSVMPDGWGQYL
jgi:hypothetical protein